MGFGGKLVAAGFRPGSLGFSGLEGGKNDHPMARWQRGDHAGSASLSLLDPTYIHDPTFIHDPAYILDQAYSGAGRSRRLNLQSATA